MVVEGGLRACHLVLVKCLHAMQAGGGKGRGEKRVRGQ